MNYSSRVATEKDVSRINELVNSAYRGESSKVGWTTEADLLGGQRIDSERVAELIRDPNQRILCLCDSKGIIVSVVNLRRFQDVRGPGCYLGMLTVEPLAQAQGIGRAMLFEAEKFAREWGANRITLTVIQLRTELIGWYERRGYRQTGEFEEFPYGDTRFGQPKRDDLHFIVFEKELVPNDV
jgi:GNAT superfamily N-acetyltransferase